MSGNAIDQNSAILSVIKSSVNEEFGEWVAHAWGGRAGDMLKKDLSAYCEAHVSKE